MNAESDILREKLVQSRDPDAAMPIGICESWLLAAILFRPQCVNSDDGMGPVHQQIDWLNIFIFVISDNVQTWKLSMYRHIRQNTHALIEAEWRIYASVNLP